MTLTAWQATVQHDDGDFVVNPSITVRFASDNSLADIFSDAGGTTTLVNPFLGTAEGFVQFYAAPGKYLIQGAKGGSQTQEWVVDLAYSVPEFISRAQATAATTGQTGDAQFIVVQHPVAGRLEYKYNASGTALTTGDGRKWEAHGKRRPEHYGTVNGGDDHATLVAWAAAGGDMEATPGAVYRGVVRTAPITIAADAVCDFKNAVYQQEFTPSGDGSVWTVNEGATLRNLKWTTTSTFYSQRALLTYGNVFGLNFVANTEFPTGAVTDDRDGFIIIKGPNCHVEDCCFNGARRCVITSPDDDTSGAVIRNIHIWKNSIGVALRATAEGAVVDGVYIYSKGANSGMAEGVNAVTGSAPHAIVRNVQHMAEGSASGEHFVYSPGADGLAGMRFESIGSNGSGQCGIKMRGHDGFLVDGADIRGTSTGNTPSLNEEGFRGEYLRNGEIKNVSISKIDDNFGGTRGVYLKACWNLRFSNIAINQPATSYIHLAMGTIADGYSSPPDDALSELSFNGVTCTGAGDLPFLVLGIADFSEDTTIKVGNITIAGLIWDGDLADLVRVGEDVTFVTRVAGTRIMIDGVCNGVAFTYVWAADGEPTLTTVDTARGFLVIKDKTALATVSPDQFTNASDTDKVQAAITAALSDDASITLGRIFDLDGAVELHPGLYINAINNGGVRRADLSSGFDLFTLGSEGSDISLASLRIDGNRDGQSAPDNNDALFSLNSGSTSLPGYLSYCTVTNRGSGYVSAPGVVFTGGGGSGATATAVVSGGEVISVLINDGGSGYTTAPTISFTGGGGAGATATVDTEPNSGRFSLRWCKIWNWSYEGQGLNILGFRGVDVDGCNFWDGGSDLWHAIYARRVSDFRAASSTFRDVYGASIKAMSIGKGGRAIAVGNIIDNTLRAVNFTDFSDFAIVGNTITRVYYGNAYGITVAQDAGDTAPRRGVITGNTLTRCRSRGITVSNALSLAISGNHLSDCGEILLNLRGCREVNIEGNQFAFRDLRNLRSEASVDPGDDLEEAPWENSPPYLEPSAMTVAAINIAEGATSPSSIRIGDNVFSATTDATTHAITTDATAGTIRIARDVEAGITGFTTKITDPNGTIKGRPMSGTFTPAFAPTTNAFTSVVYDSYATGQYTVTPEGWCDFSLSIRTDDVQVGTASGALRISGLPYAAASTSSYGEAANCVAQCYGATGWTNHPYEAVVVAGQSYIELRKISTAGGATAAVQVSDMLAGVNANSNSIRISGRYRISPSIII